MIALPKAPGAERSPTNKAGAPTVRILVTGFGSFPGVPLNPTRRLISALAGRKARFARLGVELHACILPVTYSGAPERLEALISNVRPQAILHFGFAARRGAVCIETRALNRTSVLRPDAQRFAPRRAILEAPFALRSALPSQIMAATFRRAGLKSELSIDAGDYVCNHIFYLSLSSMKPGLAGFVHIPPLQRTGRRIGAIPDHRPKFETLAGAAFIAIIDVARSLRCVRCKRGGKQGLIPARMATNSA
jgi:pyroglutamyl-peptidase